MCKPCNYGHDSLNQKKMGEKIIVGDGHGYDYDYDSWFTGLVMIMSTITTPCEPGFSFRLYR